MKKISLSSVLIFALTLTVLSACGGGGGGGGGAAAQPTTAVLKLISSGTGTTMSGLDVTVVLPTGVTVRSISTPTTPWITDTGVVTATGAASGADLALGAYTPVSGPVPGKIKIDIVKLIGFTTGEFSTVTCDIAPGTMPTAGNFSLTLFNPVDMHGATIPGLTAGFTADIH